jgi:hypothetical protein
MRTHRWIGTAMALCLGLSAVVGCDTMKDNPRTTGTVGGAAGGAALGAAIDRDDPGTGAVLGGVAGGVAGNVAGKAYKDHH